MTYSDKKFCFIMGIIFLIITLPLCIFFAPKSGEPRVYKEVKFDKSLIDKIELKWDDEVICATDPNELNEITSCFGTDLTVVPLFYDIMATGGCNGIHWTKPFELKFFSGENGFSMDLGGCSGGYSITFISKEFVTYDGLSAFKTWLISNNNNFSVGCDYGKLQKVLSKYNNEISIQ